jgi:hypothetical protein
MWTTLPTTKAKRKWYQPNLTRATTAQFLAAQPIGSFVVRTSNFNSKALPDVKWFTLVEHCREGDPPFSLLVQYDPKSRLLRIMAQNPDDDDIVFPDFATLVLGLVVDPSLKELLPVPLTLPV